jgi:hypothetical protein
MKPGLSVCQFANRDIGLNNADKLRKKDGSKNFRNSEPVLGDYLRAYARPETQALYMERPAGLQVLCRSERGHFQSEKNRHAGVASTHHNLDFMISNGELFPDFVFKERFR